MSLTVRNCLTLLPALCVLATLPAVGCIEPLTIDDPPPQAELASGETRRIELRYLRFDVEGFEKTLDLEDLEALPQTTLDGVWLLDLELTPLVKNALTQLTFAQFCMGA